MGTKKNRDRKIKALTGKGGAIEAILALTRAICEYLNLPEDEICRRVKIEREQLEEELKEGVYYLCTDTDDDYIKYLGDYSD